MKYTEEMILQSDSGYCMPFEEQQGKDVELSLGYGEQTDPATIIAKFICTDCKIQMCIFS